MKVFLDSNVLVAAFATRGLCRDLLAQLILKHEPMLAEPVLVETRRVLTGKLGMPGARVERLLGRLRRYHVDRLPLDAIDVDVRDPNDVEIVRYAIACGADVLVSGDRDLLEAVLPIRLLSPRALWQALRQGLQPDVIHEPVAPFGR